MRRDPDLNKLRLPLPAMQLYLFVDEARKPLYSIQDGFNLQLNSWPPGCSVSVFINSRLSELAGVQLFVVSGCYWRVNPSSSGRWEKWKSRRFGGIFKRRGKVPPLDLLG